MIGQYLVARDIWGDRQMRDGPNTWQWGLLAVWVPKDFSTPSANARLKGPWEDCGGLVSMHIIQSDMLMNVSHVMFRWIVAQIFLTGLKIKFEVFLCFAIQQPEVPHLHCTGMLAFDRFIDNVNGSGVVNLNGCRWLWMAKFQEGKL